MLHDAKSVQLSIQNGGRGVWHVPIVPLPGSASDNVDLCPEANRIFTSYHYNQAVRIQSFPHCHSNKLCA